MKSDELFQSAQRHLVGGAGAGGRYHPLLKRPLYFARGLGSRLWDVDGVEYIDFFTGSGANFLGHGHPAVAAAIRRALEVGVICNGETEYHARLADLVADAVPCAEMVRFANSGTEATMGAIRIARGFTRKPKILKFEGHFHGMHDYLWYNCAAGLGEQRPDGTIAPRADSEGMPEALAELIVVVPFNDAEAFAKAIRAHGHELAAVIVEPIAYNQGCIPADPEFLRAARELTARHGALLVFDEVIAGFRFRAGACSTAYGVRPDLACFAKAMGGGMPVAAVAGRADVMALAGRGGGVKFSGGTYSGHPASMLAAKTMMSWLEDHEQEIYPAINALGAEARKIVEEALRAEGFPAHCTGRPNAAIGGSSVGAVTFPYDPAAVISSPDEARNPEICDVELADTVLQLALLLEDVHVVHGLGSVSTAHTRADISRLGDACRSAGRRIATVR